MTEQIRRCSEDVEERRVALSKLVEMEDAERTNYEPHSTRRPEILPLESSRIV